MITDDQTSVVRYRYRAYPTGPQRQALSQLFGCCRVAYNDTIALASSTYAIEKKYAGATALQHRVLTVAKATVERAWMNDVSGVALIQSVRDADLAYRNFFSSLKGTRRGKKVGLPTFKSRHDRNQSARFTSAARYKVVVTSERAATLALPKIGPVPFVLSRALPSESSSVTVIREPDGRYYVSFVVRVQNVAQPTTGRRCGIDPGLEHFATICSVDIDTGEETVSQIETPKFLRARARALRRSQQSHSRKRKGSNNREKARVKVSVQHRKVREARLDHAHQMAHRVVSGHDIIALENTNVEGMMKTRRAKSLADQSLAQFSRLIVEKAQRRGVVVVKVGKFFPSTQQCSSCSSITGPKGQSKLSVREWTCSECGVTHNRDVNAARNILVEGLRLLGLNEPPLVADGRSETLNASRASGRPESEGGGGEVRPPASPVALAREAGRIKKARSQCQAA